MSHKLTCRASGWGTVRNPLDEDERLKIEDGVLKVDDTDLAHALADEYGPLSLVESSEDDATDSDESTDDESEDEQPTCAGKDGECSREVDEEGEYCWQHSDEE